MKSRALIGCWTLLAWVAVLAKPTATDLDLSHTTIVIRSGPLPPAEQTAAQVLQEEVRQRTGRIWPISTHWPARGAVVALASGPTDPGWARPLPKPTAEDSPARRAEGFRLASSPANARQPVVWICGADARGALFGAGQFLRSLHWGPRQARFAANTDLATAPVQRIRGHQLGYRNTANSWDGWDVRQFEQYIRELAIFGANSIEGIPFHDTKPSPVMKVPREVMNQKISEICARYELDYWVWVPADFKLEDPKLRAEALARHDELFRTCPRLDGVFVPGGDPGDNEPELVMPYLQDLGALLAKHHPRAKVWVSMQGYEKRQVDAVYDWINTHQPGWLGGLAAGPSSPSIPATRARLPRRYGLRDYPDITHTVRCQFPVPWWDPALNFTLGRECSNPRPQFYRQVHHWLAPHDDGFISYSDGVHDDVNKTIWSQLGWNPEGDPRAILVEYARFFFGPALSESAADGILALEQNWVGPLAANGSVDTTLTHWRILEAAAPRLRNNWRWQLCLLRAYFDAYARHRLIHEAALEKEAMGALDPATGRNSTAGMAAAEAILGRAVPSPVQRGWRQRIEELCADLFQSVCLQTSVKKYHASGAERGAILDSVDHPLNNRWWLEDEFKRIRALPDETQRRQALELIRTWENPGPGSYYDEVGNVAKSPHVLRSEGLNTDPLVERVIVPGFWFWDAGQNRRRLSWQTSMDWPAGLVYENLDPQGAYRIRLTGYGEAKVRVNGELLSPTAYAKDIGQFKEFPVPSALLKEGRLRLTFDALDEAHLNWRQQSRVSEVWLLKGR